MNIEIKNEPCLVMSLNKEEFTLMFLLIGAVSVNEAAKTINATYSEYKLEDLKDRLLKNLLDTERYDNMSKIYKILHHETQ